MSLLSIRDGLCPVNKTSKEERRKKEEGRRKKEEGRRGKKKKGDHLFGLDWIGMERNLTSDIWYLISDV